jgi:L-aminopeptidase/D-esterase-like protein
MRPPLNTTLAVVATDARLDKSECGRMAMTAHDGMARAVSPIHLYTDGDVAFALATGAREVPDVRGDGGHIRPTDTRPGQLGLLCAAAADCVARAIVHAVLAATSAGGLSSYLTRFPSAVGRRGTAASN